MKKYIIHIAAVIVMLITGCQAARMPVPDSLTTSERLEVKGRQGWKINEYIRFGTYEAVEIDRSWTKGGDLQVLIYEGNKRKQQYTFLLRNDQSDNWRVSCKAFLRKRTIYTRLVDVELKNRSEVDCQLNPLGDPSDTWTLTLKETRERPLEGSLTNTDQKLDVFGTTKLQKGLPAETTTGYQILESGQPLAAVEVINEGAVVLDSRIDRSKQSLLAATAAALLLLEDLRVHLPEDQVAAY